ncbi:MAG: FISUMP domain-containing protein [Bacteroidales bacterium]|nr:FISUMP domain-containing protein [Bacteroidales bacterium]MDD3543726.1 FISUMP domain-containing protein [Petrimonas sp.]MDD3945814.1 FISUMP domain-containing protein [Bacteroidales bacterium]
MKKTIISLFALVFIYSCTLIPQEAPNTFTDSRDSHIYIIVTIGEQVWMAENLAYLPSIVGPETGSEDAGQTTNHFYYVYGYDGTDVLAAKATTFYATYGVLYNWAAALTACPEGWHLPSDLEWTTLTDYLGGVDVAGGKMKEIGTCHWNTPSLIPATNESGFSALPGGGRGSNGTFYRIGNLGYWLSSTEVSTNKAWIRALDYYTSGVGRTDHNNNYGFSVRCVRD